MSYVSRFGPYLKLACAYASISANCSETGHRIVRDTLRQIGDNVIFMPGIFDDELELLRRVQIEFEIQLGSEAVLGTIPGDGTASPFGNLPNPMRQAAFLSEVAGYSEDDIRLVTGLSRKDAEAFICAHSDITSARTRQRALIVEDDIWIARHLQDLIEEAGLTSMGIAKTSSQAVDLARETQPELMLCDVNLDDGSSGIQSVLEIQSNKSIPTVFVTAFPDAVRSLHPMASAAIVAKPFHDFEVIEGVNKALRQARAATAV